MLAARVGGKLNLAGLLCGEMQEVFALCSPLTALTGAVGQPAYTAARALQVAWRQQAAAAGADLDNVIWKERGMAPGAQAPHAPREPARSQGLGRFMAKAGATEFAPPAALHGQAAGAALRAGKPGAGLRVIAGSAHDAGDTTMGLYRICATALLEPGTERGMVHQWRCLLDGAIAQRDMPAAALQLLDAAQYQAVLAVARRPVGADWKPEDEAGSIHRQVQARALRSLEAVEVS